jgi:hypothetical protein
MLVSPSPKTGVLFTWPKIEFTATFPGAAATAMFRYVSKVFQTIYFNHHHRDGEQLLKAFIHNVLRIWIKQPAETFLLLRANGRT